MAKRVIDCTGADYLIVSPEMTIFEATNQMISKKVTGALVKDGGKYVGIFSEGDIFKKVIPLGLEPKKNKVKDVMTSSIQAIRANAGAVQALEYMLTHGIRRLPLKDEQDQIINMVEIQELAREILTMKK